MGSPAEGAFGFAVMRMAPMREWLRVAVGRRCGKDREMRRTPVRSREHRKRRRRSRGYPGDRPPRARSDSPPRGPSRIRSDGIAGGQCGRIGLDNAAGRASATVRPVSALAPGLSVLDARLPEDVTARSPLGTAWRALRGISMNSFRRIWSRHELDRFVNFAGTKSF
jgi:hypothetical protein